MSKILTTQKIPNAFEDGMGGNIEEYTDDIELIEKGELKEPLLNQIENEKTGTRKTQMDENENLIMRATALHILGDIIQSVGVVIASTIIYLFQDSNPRPWHGQICRKPQLCH